MGHVCRPRRAAGFADVFKLLFKEVVHPAQAQQVLYVLAPLITLVPAFAAWAVVPFDAQMALSNANAGLLYLLAMTSLGIYGIIIAGWASNSKYALLGAMRAAAQWCPTKSRWASPWSAC